MSITPQLKKGKEIIKPNSKWQVPVWGQGIGKGTVRGREAATRDIANVSNGIGLGFAGGITVNLNFILCSVNTCYIYSFVCIKYYTIKNIKDACLASLCVHICANSFNYINVIVKALLADIHANRYFPFENSQAKFSVTIQNILKFKI